jgi:C4-dicarboxylate-binding protein DctP
MIGKRALCLLLACLVLAPPFAARAQQVKLRITLQTPATDHLGVNLMQFKAEVEKRSDGAISVEVFGDSRLYRDDQAVDAVASGAIEMASVGSSQLVRRIPALDIFGQPFLFNFDALVQAGTGPDSEIRKVLDKTVLDGIGVRVLWRQPFGSSVFVSKGVDVRTPAGIRGRKIRAWAPNVAKFIRLCGGDARVISSAKLITALEDGTVEMLMTGISTVRSRALWKLLDTITRTGHAALEFPVIINEKLWQSLSDSHKAIISAAARNAERDLRQSMSDVEADAYAFAISKGMKVYELTPSEVAAWRACSAGIMDDYMDAGKVAIELIAAYGRLRTLPCCSDGPKGEFPPR